MATQFTVQYEDGAKKTYTVKPKHILKVEREGGGLSASIESSYKLAWLSSNTEKTFDEWLEIVDDIEPVDDTEGDTNPT
jgi:hypothetical protein